jgi:lipase
VTLALHAWGDPAGTPVVCLHGVTGHGRHFARLAERLQPAHVLAPDLLGHGDSPYEPPWTIDAHLRALLATVPERPA